MNEILKQIIEEYQIRNGQPKITHAKRSHEEQVILFNSGERKSAVSSHETGMAADLSFNKFSEVVRAAGIVSQIAKELNVSIRLGFCRYNEEGKNILHIDVCPEFYAEGKPLHTEAHPKKWEYLS